MSIKHIFNIKNIPFKVNLSYLLIMSEKYKVLVTRCDIPQSALKLLENSCELEIWPEESVIPREKLLEKVANKDGLFIVSSDKIDREILDAAGEKLKVIATMSAGYDHIDVNEARSRGIRLGFTPGILDDAVAELTIGLLLSCTRRLFEGHQKLVEGSWKSWERWSWLNGVGLKDSVVGIVGLGRIGLEVARRLVPFRVKKILYTSRTVKKEAEDLGAGKVDLEKLLKESDIIVVTCALTKETHNLLSEKEFGLMKKGAIIVNTSRGAVIDQNALINALKESKIGGAALDVMTPEPLPTDHELLLFPNCCVVPHLGSAEVKTRMAMAEMTAKNIVAGLEKKELVAEIIF